MAKSLVVKTFAVVILASGLPAALVAGLYNFDRMWPVIPERRYFDEPHGVAVDASGNVYVADTGLNRVSKYNQAGQLIWRLGRTDWSFGAGDGEFSDPWRVVVGPSGKIYVMDRGNTRVQVFNADGVFINKWGTSGWGDDQLVYPVGLAVDSSENVYISDLSMNRVQKFTSDGIFITKWGSAGTGDGQFGWPLDVAVGPSGSVYVVDGSRVQVFSSDGTFVAKWGSYGTADGQFNNPYGISIDTSGNVFVADGRNNRIQKFSSDGVFLGKWGRNGGDGTAGFGDGEFSFPIDVALDASGNIYVADGLNDRIQKFSSAGAFISKWGAAGDANGWFHNPISLAIDESDYIFVADYENNRIQKFKNDGAFVKAWGSYGRADGLFQKPFSITTAKGYVYVLDWAGDGGEPWRIQKFTSDGAFVSKFGGFQSYWWFWPGGQGKFANPMDIAADSSGNIYVADTGNYRVQKLGPDGLYATVWGGGGCSFNEGAICEPIAIGVNKTGVVYVLDLDNGIQQFTSDGQYIARWSWNSVPGSGDGQFDWPYGVGFDISGSVFIADSNNSRIQKLDATGGFITKWGSWGDDPGQFILPHDVAVDSQGAVYVADFLNHRIQKFVPAGGAYVPAGSFDVSGTVRILGGKFGYIKSMYGEHGTIIVTPKGAGEIRVRIYDMQGFLVKEIKRAGQANRSEVIQWDATDTSGKSVPPGLYPVIVEAPGIKYKDKLAVAR